MNLDEKIGEFVCCHGCCRRIRMVAGHTRMEQAHTRMGDYPGGYTRVVRSPVLAQVELSGDTRMARG